MPRLGVYRRKDVAQGPEVLYHDEQQHEQVLVAVEFLDIAFPADATGES